MRAPPPGLEPEISEPKSEVLPITLRRIGARPGSSFHAGDAAPPAVPGHGGTRRRLLTPPPDPCTVGSARRPPCCRVQVRFRWLRWAPRSTARRFPRGSPAVTPPSSVLGSASAVGTPASPRTARPIAPGPESVVAGRRPGAAQTGVLGSVLIPLSSSWRRCRSPGVGDPPGRTSPSRPSSPAGPPRSAGPPPSGPPVARRRPARWATDRRRAAAGMTRTAPRRIPPPYPEVRRDSARRPESLKL